MNTIAIDEQAHADEFLALFRPDAIWTTGGGQAYTTPEGLDVGTPLWVMSKEDGRWLLAASQNMAAPDDEVAADVEHRPIFHSEG